GQLASTDMVDELTDIARTATRGEAMLQDLLNVFRITSIEEPRQWIDTAAIVQDAIAMLRPQINDRGILVLADRMPPVWGQPKKLRHAVTNLLSNAVRHSPRHSGVVRIDAAQDGSHMTVRVSDNGVGIPPEYHQRIFELFGRVPEEETAQT